jgi:hypothetical protein
MLKESKSFLGRFREVADEQFKDFAIKNGTQTGTRAATEVGDSDASITSGTHTLTGVPKEANDADPVGFGPTLLPRKMTRARRALKY